MLPPAESLLTVQQLTRFAVLNQDTPHLAPIKGMCFHHNLCGLIWRPFIDLHLLQTVVTSLFNYEFCYYLKNKTLGMPVAMKQ